MHFMLLMVLFWLWLEWDRRRDDDAPLLPWLRRKKPRKQPEPLPTECDQPYVFPRKITNPPPLRERIDSCWQDEEAYLEELWRVLRKPEGPCELLMLLHTPGKMYRAAIFRSGKRYWVYYDYLRLHDVDDLFDWSGQGCAYGWWEPDPGMHGYEDLESAEENARAVLHQLEKAEQAQLEEPELPDENAAPGTPPDVRVKT